ncbi:MAG: alpha-E domain-containing protein [Bacteroidales bacterium]|nr:alpha-E domain-containing protein [Bacteroidales bacterium]
MKTTTTTTIMKSGAISPMRADRLYWLGRYAERVCMSLHLIRKFYNRMIDCPTGTVHHEFCALMGLPAPTSDSETFLADYLYSRALPWSIFSTLENLKNNAMLERDDIGSETLAYIELACNKARDCASRGAGLYELQSVTDAVMAFWGAVGENIRYRCIHDLIAIGRSVERADLLIRFGYDTARIVNELERIADADENYLNLCDKATLDALRCKVAEPDCNAKSDILLRLNGIFAA